MPGDTSPFPGCFCHHTAACRVPNKGVCVLIFPLSEMGSGCREGVLIHFLCVRTYTPGVGFFISSPAEPKKSHTIINVERETLAGLH